MKLQKIVILLLILGIFPCFGGKISLENSQKVTIIASHFNLQISKKDYKDYEKRVFENSKVSFTGNKNTVTDLFVQSDNKRFYLGSFKGCGDYKIIEPAKGSLDKNANVLSTLFAFYKKKGDFWFLQASVVRVNRTTAAAIHEKKSLIFNRHKNLLHDDGCLERLLSKNLRLEKCSDNFSFFQKIY